MKLSKHTYKPHFEIRQQQRGIKDKTISLLFKEGKQSRQSGGTALVVFPKSKKPVIEKNNLKIKNIKNAFIVIEVDEKNLTDSPIITTGHNYKNIHKKSHRNFHRKSNKKFH